MTEILRRDLLKSVGALGLARFESLPKGHFEEHPLSVLARFNQQFVHYAVGEAVGDYLVQFTGLMLTQESRILVGHWLAWGAKEPRRYFVATVPDPFPKYLHAYEYFPGAVFYMPNTLSSSDLMEECDWPRIMTMVQDGRNRLLSHLQDIRLI